MARIAIELNGKITQIQIQDEQKAEYMLTAFMEEKDLLDVKSVLRFWANQIQAAAIKKQTIDDYNAIKDAARQEYQLEGS